LPGFHLRLMLGALALVWLCEPIASAAAAPRRSAADERVIAQCIRKAAGRRAWLERTLWGLRDQEGGWIGAEIANANGTHDLGPLQVNSWWVPRLAVLTRRSPGQVRHWLKHDVCFNADTARWIFLSALAATGDYWKAIGSYHSPIPWRQMKYRTAVAQHIRRRFGRAAFRGSVLGRR
jgi:hypothetical protein